MAEFDRDALKENILYILKSGNGTGVQLYNLCRTVNQPKKYVNSVLYELQKNQIVEKVVESPPYWRLRPRPDGGPRSPTSVVNEASSFNRHSVVRPNFRPKSSFWSPNCAQQSSLEPNKQLDRPCRPIGRGRGILGLYNNINYVGSSDCNKLDNFNCSGGGGNMGRGVGRLLLLHSQKSSNDEYAGGYRRQSTDYAEYHQSDQYRDENYNDSPEEIMRCYESNEVDYNEDCILNQLHPNQDKPDTCSDPEASLSMMDIGPDIKMKEDNKVPIGPMEFSQTSGENYGTNESPCDFNQKASPNDNSLPVISSHDNQSVQPSSLPESHTPNAAPHVIFDPPNTKSSQTKTAIIEYLRQATKPVNTLAIARAIGSIPKNVISRFLHELSNQGLVVRVQESPPQWQIRDQYQDGIQKENSSEGFSVNEDSGGGGGKNSNAPPLPPHKLILLESAFNSLKVNEGEKLENLTSSNEVSDILPLQIVNKLPFSASDDKTMLSVLGSLSTESFAALMKNPMSALHEYGQKHQVEAKVDIIESTGPSHQPKFKAAAFVNNKMLSESWASTKKDAKRQAAELAIRYIVVKQAAEHNLKSKFSLENVQEIGSSATLFDVIAAVSHREFNIQALRISDHISGRKVLAAFVMQTATDEKGSVVSFGTGNRCITGEHLSQDGLVVNDSHAEVVARRGFLRFLYTQLKSYSPDKDHPIFEPSENEGKLKIKSSVSFHLYISTAPCGDGALFTRNVKPSDASKNEIHEHSPLFTNNLQGLLRTKVEAGEGTIPVDNKVGVQAWDAIVRGDRLRTMSCSDKIARWNVLGLQGALLSHFLEPIYMASVTLGHLYHHGHISRALCCRLKSEPELDTLLPSGYSLNHPKLGQITAFSPPRETEKTRHYSINWTVGDEKPELIDGVAGARDEKCDGPTESRICKRAMFDSFKALCEHMQKTELLGKSYGDTKLEAETFQEAKNALFKRCADRKLGTWVQKPPEEKMFF